MNYPINYKKITDKTEFYSEVMALHKRAEAYLKGFKWCDEIKNCSLYTNIGRVFCIFLFEIENSASREDNFLWVIVGDIPSMYLDTFGPKTTKEVVEEFVGLAEDWIDSIKAGVGVDECYPFNTEPTLELAELLEKKVSFMKSTLMDNMEDIKLKA
jgi:hypothetical protein